jgi:methyl-accepting chemotaxis protein
MDGLVGAMHDLNESSRSIARIIKVIDEIAFQTNLLALNAAVEAARAGKHGRGFAVVANEVRNLASRSAKAAEETETLIEATLGKVAQGTKQANRTAEMLDEIVDIGHRSAVLVGEIATASEEQAKGAAEVGIALDQVQSVTQDNTAQAEEVAAAATELSSQSQALRRLINRFRIGDGRLRELPASAPDEYAGTEAPETEAQGAPRAGVPPANLPPVDPVHAAMAPAETDPQDATTEATETTETAAVPEDAETRDADADIREDADPSAEAESDPAAAAHGANQETAQNASQGENPPREKLDEFVLPDQVIALDDEEFGRY